jgi:hypothetical protein
VFREILPSVPPISFSTYPFETNGETMSAIVKKVPQILGLFQSYLNIIVPTTKKG